MGTLYGFTRRTQLARNFRLLCTRIFGVVALGILLVVCSTERVGPTDYVDYLLSPQVNGREQHIGRVRAVPLKW